MINTESKKITKIQNLIQSSLAEIENNQHQSESWKVGYLEQTLRFTINIIEHGNVYGNEAEKAIQHTESFSKALQKHDDNDLRPF